MKNILFLPYPKLFASFCKYSLDEAIPIWISGCVNKNNNKNLFFSELFNKNLEFKNLDKASREAINEFAVNIIDVDNLLKNLDFPSHDLKLEYFIDYQPIIKTLHGNNIFTTNDILQLGLENLSKLQSLGIKKVIYIAISIAELNNNTDVLAKEETFVSMEEIIGVVENRAKTIPLDRFYLSDPRFRKIYQEYNVPFNTDLFEYPTWYDLFFFGSSSESSSVLDLLEKFTKEYKKLESLSLEEQMSQFFLTFIRSTRKPSLLERHIDNFEVVKDRLGIKESIEEVYTLQKSADLFNPPITRERIRQIEKQYKVALDVIPEGEEIFFPKLNAVLKIFYENINRPVNEISTILSDKGLGSWNIKRVLHCLDLFRLPNQLTIDKDCIVDKSMIKANNYITQMAIKIIRYNGIVNIDHLHESISSNFSVERDYLLSTLKSSSFEELSQDWFYKYTKENHLISLAQRIANFSKVYSVQSLREGHMKHKGCRETSLLKRRSKWFHGYRTPPSSAIGRVIDFSNDFRVKDGNIYCDNLDNKYIDDPSGADYQFLKYFQARNFDCSTYDEMKTYFIVQNHMPEGSFFQYLTYKPYIKRLSPQVYGIIGHEADLLSVNNARNRIRKSTPVKIEWVEVGLEVKLKLKVVNNFVLSLHDYDDYIIKDEFKVFHNNQEYCSLKRSATLWYGLGRYLDNILFCEINDFIRIKLNLESYEARVELISEDEFED